MQNLLSAYQKSIYHPIMVLICGLIAFSVIDGGQPSALLLLLALLPLTLQNGFFVNVGNRKWLVALICPLVVSIPLFIGSKTGEALDAPARYFAAAICLIALSKYPIRSELILRSASIGSIITLVFKFALLSEARVDWGVGILESGYLGVVMLALSISQYYTDKGKLVWRIISVLGIICALIIVVKTGSRGTWPAIIFVCLMHLLLVPVSVTKKIMAICIGAIILIMSFLYVPSISQRVDLSVQEFKAYYYENNHATSLGYRLDFWHIAVRGFMESPIWGVSYDRRSEIMDEFMEQYPESKHIGNDGRSSSHNEILNAMSKKGLLGLVGILLLYLAPLQFFIRHMKREWGWKIRRVAAAGVGVVATMVICGLSEAPLMNVRVATTYAFVLIFLFHAINHLMTQQGAKIAATASDPPSAPPQKN